MEITETVSDNNCLDSKMAENSPNGNQPDVSKLEAELTEARAQIAAYEEERQVFMTSTTDLLEALGQIAAMKEQLAKKEGSDAVRMSQKEPASRERTG